MCRHEVEEGLRRAGVGVDAIFAEAEPGLMARVRDRADGGGCDLIIVDAAVRDDDDRHALANIRGAALLPVLSVREFTPDRRFVDSAAQHDFAASSAGRARARSSAAPPG
jgi:hypothetical protein